MPQTLFLKPFISSAPLLNNWRFSLFILINPNKTQKKK
jgi:hypothetical protein